MIHILIDHSNLLYRAYYSSKHHLELKPWLPILRYVDMLRVVTTRAIQRYPDRSIALVFAGESRTILQRTRRDATYKANRTPAKDKALRDFRKIIPLIINGFGWDVLCINGSEADDVIASIAKRNSEKKDVQTIVYSNDRDLRQLLTIENVVIFQNPGMFYTGAMFIAEYGFDPVYFLSYKALVGDKSDNISGVSGWGPAKAKKHILSKDWSSALETPEDLKAYSNSLALSKLDESLDCSVQNRKPRNTDYEKKAAMLYTKEALGEIKLYLDRLDVFYN